MSSNKMVCFFDLLGTKESSRVSEEDYYNAISTFHKTLDKFKDNAKFINAFSDCAFMELPIDKHSFNFLDNLRDSMFSKGYYFKCSIISGNLEIHTLGKNNKNFGSVSFGPDSVKAYLDHESFKGIGYHIDKTLHDNANFKKYIVSSFFIEDEKNYVYRHFWDLMFSKTYIGNHKYIDNFRESKIILGSENHAAETNLDFYFKNFVIAKTKKKEYTKYYIPTIISLINSSDFSNITYQNIEKEKTEFKKWSGIPLILFRILFDTKFQSKIATFQGSEILYYAALNKLYHDINSNDGDPSESDIVKDKVAEIFSNRPRLKNFISRVPNSIFNNNYRNDFLSRVANFELS